jgi:hypothetical protein
VAQRQVGLSAEERMSAASPGNPGTKVFIAGAPRSGTSVLLYAMKDVFGLPGHGESHVMPVFNRMLRVSSSYLTAVESAGPRVVKNLLVRELSRQAIEEHLFRFVRDFYGAKFPAGSWVDKTPGGEGVLALQFAARVFPDARLIVTKRNGIEVVASHIKKFNASFDKACAIWNNTMDAVIRIQSECRNLLVVDQYDFNNSAGRVATEIALHVGMPEKAQELAAYLLQERVEHSSEYDWSKRMRLADTSWSGEQKETFLAVCGNTMKSLGYEL